MKKIYAVMQDEELFDYNVYFDDCQAEELEIYIGGNRDFYETNAKLVDNIKNALSSCGADVDSIVNDDSMSDEDREEEKINTLNYYFSDKTSKDITNNKDVQNKLLEFCETYETTWFNVEEELSFIAQVLSFLKDKQFVSGEITGYGQGDWNYYICPKELQQYVSTDLEAIYFGMASEYKIAILDDTNINTSNIDELIEKIDESATCHYNCTYLYKDDDIKEWLAKTESTSDNFSKDDVVLINIEDSYTVKNYKYKVI